MFLIMEQGPTVFAQLCISILVKLVYTGVTHNTGVLAHPFWLNIISFLGL